MAKDLCVSYCFHAGLPVLQVLVHIGTNPFPPHDSRLKTRNVFSATSSRHTIFGLRRHAALVHGPRGPRKGLRYSLCMI